MPEQFIPPEAPVATPVQWFPNADPNESPHAAQVIAVQASGALSLAVTLTSGRPARMTGVRHIDDPAFASMAQDVKVTRGAWGHVPGIARTKTPRDQAEQEREICRLYAEEPNVPKIVGKLGGYPWNQNKVNGVLRRHRHIK